MIAPNTVLSNRYLVTDLLGQGGMGAVYKATDKKFNNFVAIKETINTNDSQMRNAFLQEATLLNRLRHPALPVVTDFFVLGNNMYLVMQYIPGKSVDALLEERELLGYRGIDVKLAVKWSDRLMDAVEYLHTQEAPIIHRDIKPQNLRLTPEGELVLLDFGLAKGVPAGRSHAARSIPGYTPNYSSPEQIRCTGTDHRSDIYSIGATMYHMITGEKPVEVLGRLVAQAMKEPDPLQPVLKVNPDIPYMTAQVIEKAMSFQPEDRYPSVVVMRQALRKAELITELADQIPDANDPIYVNGVQDQTGYTGAMPKYNDASGQLRNPTATIAAPSRDSNKTILYNSQQEPALYAAAAANGASRILNSYGNNQAQSQPLHVNVQPTGVINPGKQLRKKFFSKALPLNPKVWVTIGFVFVAYMAIYSFLGNFSNFPFVNMYNRITGNAEATGGGKAGTSAPAVLKNYSSPVEAFRYSVLPKKSRNGSVESYKLLFNAKMNGYVYLFSAAKDGSIQALITNGATIAKDGISNSLEANKDFQYPAKDGWLRFTDRSNTASYLVIFTPEKLEAPEFFSFLPGSVMSPPQIDALKDFRKRSDGFVPVQSEGSKSEAIVQIPGDIAAKRPLIFKIDLQLKK